MEIEKIFEHWKKDQGINYVEGQDDLLNFAEDYAQHQIKELKGL